MRACLSLSHFSLFRRLVCILCSWWLISDDSFALIAHVYNHNISTWYQASKCHVEFAITKPASHFSGFCLTTNNVCAVLTENHEVFLQELTCVVMVGGLGGMGKEAYPYDRTSLIVLSPSGIAVFNMLLCVVMGVCVWLPSWRIFSPPFLSPSLFLCYSTASDLPSYVPCSLSADTWLSSPFKLRRGK